MDAAVMNQIGVNEFNLSEYGKLQVIGTTGEVTVCFCCGKENLKRTAVMQDSQGNYSFFGTTCAYNASNKWATSKSQNRTVSIPVEVVIAGRKNRVYLDGQVEYFNPVTQEWKAIAVKGFFNLILDNIAGLSTIENINKVIEILETYTSFRIPF